MAHTLHVDMSARLCGPMHGVFFKTICCLADYYLNTFVCVIYTIPNKLPTAVMWSRNLEHAIQKQISYPPSPLRTYTLATSIISFPYLSRYTNVHSTLIPPSLRNCHLPPPPPPICMSESPTVCLSPSHYGTLPLSLLP